MRLQCDLCSTLCTMMMSLDKTMRIECNTTLPFLDKTALSEDTSRLAADDWCCRYGELRCVYRAYKWLCFLYTTSPPKTGTHHFQARKVSDMPKSGVYCSLLHSNIHVVEDLQSSSSGNALCFHHGFTSYDYSVRNQVVYKEYHCRWFGKTAEHKHAGYTLRCAS